MNFLGRFAQQKQENPQWLPVHWTNRGSHNYSDEKSPKSDQKCSTSARIRPGSCMESHQCDYEGEEPEMDTQWWWQQKFHKLAKSRGLQKWMSFLLLSIFYSNWSITLPLAITHQHGPSHLCLLTCILILHRHMVRAVLH